MPGLPMTEPSPPPRQRADQLLVARGLFESRAKAQSAIAAGLVTANGATVRKSSDMIAQDAVVEAQAPHPWVSRGGVKLAAALDHFKFSPAGCICLDIGASTGGFTDVLLAHGARHVFAIDVGHDQLHSSLRGRADVTSREGQDIRTMSAADFPQPPDFVTVDVSFISLKLVLPAASRLCAESATIVGLIKPQFEAGRGHLKKGVVRDTTMHAQVCEEIGALTVALGWRLKGIIPSPIAGGDGNREFLFGAARD
jgi:23S rRNA (cytidine1920-2'-O)/16S rRNA (cytidine1409-2'-O)-methyltransferase